MKRQVRKFNLLSFLVTIIGAAAITFFELNNTLIDHDFAAILYLLLLTIAALLWDYTSGAVALLASAICLDYIVPPIGFDLSALTVRKILLFSIAGIVILVLAWRARILRVTNKDLIKNTNKLQEILRRMQKQARGNEQELAKLTGINNQLDELVSKFMEDDEFWRKRLEADAGGSGSSRSSSTKAKKSG